MIYAREQDPEKRAAFRAEVSQLTGADIIVIDETGSRLGMTPLYGRAPRAERAIDHTPRHYGRTLSLVAGLSLRGMEAAMVIEGALDQAGFLVYLRDYLLPTLPPGQIIILDNLSVHRGQAVRHLVEAHGCHFLFLPPYSPDLSPIETAFTKLKTCLRRQKALTIEALQNAIAFALDTITAHDAHAWFQHCGYPLAHSS